MNLGLEPETGGDVFSIAESRQFGSYGSRAAMWSGTAASYMNLNPAFADTSAILAGTGDRQVGWSSSVSTGGQFHATMWSGTAASAVSLHPPGPINQSLLNAMSETQQGGQVYIDQPAPLGDLFHAALWSGTPESYVDMNPPVATYSSILGMHGNQQVGVARVAGVEHAAMWSGTVESYRDLHPYPTGFSWMMATFGTAQVGYVNSSIQGSGVKAGIWFGTTQSFINLAQFLPPGAGTSVATSVEERDGVFTVGGYARYGLYFQAVVWVGVPAPSSVVVLGASGAFAVRRRR